MSIPDHSYDATLRHRPAPDGSIDAIAKRRSPELGDAGEPGGVQTRCVDLDGSWRVTEAICECLPGWSGTGWSGWFRSR